MVEWHIVGKDDFGVVPGGLNRYVAGLVVGLAALKVPVRVHIAGPSSDLKACTNASGGALTRMTTMFRSGVRASKSSNSATVVNIHFAMYGAPFLAGYFLGSRIWRKGRNATIISHFHGPWSVESKVAGVSANLSCWTKRLLELYCLRRSSRIVVLSAEFSEHLSRTAGNVDDKLAIIRPGLSDSWVEMNTTSEALPPNSGPTRRLVCVRRLTKRMGIQQFLNQLDQLDFEVGDEKLHLSIVGDGDERENLERWITENGRGGDVSILGRLSDHDLASVLASSDIAVVPTLALEGFGLVVLEAMALGVPVISTGQGGLGEAMGPWNTEEFRFSLDDASSLEASLANALKTGASPRARQALREYAVSHNWESVAAEVLAVATR